MNSAASRLLISGLSQGPCSHRTLCLFTKISRRPRTWSTISTVFSDWWKRKRSWSSIHSRSHGATRSTGNYKLLSHYHHSNIVLIPPHPCCFCLFFFSSKGTSGDTRTTSETMTYMFIMWYPCYKLQYTLHLPGRKVNSLFFKLCRENLVYQVFQVRKVKKVKKDKKECQG